MNSDVDEETEALVRRRNEIARGLTAEYRLEPFWHEVQLDDDAIRFPRLLRVDGRFAPDAWFASTHAEFGVHEPGLVAWLLAFREHFGRRPIRFIDGGALFGYFSVVVTQLFHQPEVIAVEAQPRFAEVVRRALELAAPPSSRWHVTNAFLADGTKGPSLFDVERFVVRPRAPDDLRSDRIAGSTSVRAPIVRLSDLLGEPADACAVLVKLDTEGSQASSLPAAASQLEVHRAVVVVEFDEPAKLAAFGGTTNFDVCRPLLDAGYSLWWVDHRRPGPEARRIDGPDDTIERNSLGVLIPPSTSNAPSSAHDVGV